LTGLISKIHFYIMFEDPKWIEASGRISHLVASLMRGMAKAGIRPVLSFKNGILAPTGLKTGAKDIPTGLFKQFESDIKKLKIKDKKIKVIITHCDDLPGVERLEGMIEKEFKNVEIVFVNILNNVVGAVAGPNTLTLAWREN